MPKQAARHHKKTARHERAPQHKKAMRNKKRARAKKLGQGLQSYIGGQFADALEDAEPDMVEVMEIEVTAGP